MVGLALREGQLARLRCGVPPALLTGSTVAPEPARRAAGGRRPRASHRSGVPVVGAPEGVVGAQHKPHGGGAWITPPCEDWRPDARISCRGDSGSEPQWTSQTGALSRLSTFEPGTCSQHHEDSRCTGGPPTTGLLGADEGRTSGDRWSGPSRSLRWPLEPSPATPLHRRRSRAEARPPRLTMRPAARQSGRRLAVATSPQTSRRSVPLPPRVRSSASPSAGRTLPRPRHLALSLGHSAAIHSSGHPERLCAAVCEPRSRV